MDVCDLRNYDSNSILGYCYNEIGTVHLALQLSTNSTVILKKYNIDGKESDEYKLLEQEIWLTRQLQHPNVLPLLCSFVSEQNIYVVYPSMGYGSCSNLINEYFSYGLPELAVAFILKDVLCGLEYIHKRGLIHRAIRASHILVSSCGRSCLSGLRYSCNVIKNGRWQKAIFSFPKSTSRNLKWLSPEMLEQDLRGYNEKSDIYSLGMTICELANGIEPFYEMSETLMLTEKVRGSVPYLIDQSTFPIDSIDIKQMQNDETSDDHNSSRKRIEVFSNRKFSEAFHSIAELCTQRDPANRPSVGQLLNHPFFKQCRKSDETLSDILKPVPLIQDRYKSWDGGNILARPVERLKSYNNKMDHWDFESDEN